MTGDWEAVVGDELGVGAPVTVLVRGYYGTEERVDGVVDAIWIPAKALRSVPGEIRLQVVLNDGTRWTGPHTAVERA